MLLRTAIGWHFLTEGLEKVTAPPEKPFSAEAYLRASTGPLASYFRHIVPDVDSKELLRRDEGGRPVGLKDAWTRELNALTDHYKISDAKRAAGQTALDASAATADAWFLNPENAEKVRKYLHELDAVEDIEQNPRALESQRLLAQKKRRELEATRKELVATLDTWTTALRKSWLDGDAALVTKDQLAAAGPVPAERTQLDMVNLTTGWGLTLAGAGLMLGLLTPICALAGAALLTMFYLAMPPWPGLPLPPNVEGHYWIVNKTLIELIACLVIATTPNGLWIGLDALLFGWIGRRRESAPSPTDAYTTPPGSNPATLPPHPDRPRGTTDPRQPIPVSYGAPR